MRQSLAILPRSASADTTAHRKPLGSGVSPRTPRSVFRARGSRAERPQDKPWLGTTTRREGRKPMQTRCRMMSQQRGDRRLETDASGQVYTTKNGTAQLDVTVVPMVVGRLCSSISRTQRHDVNMCGMTTRCAASVPRGKQNVGSLRPRPQGRSTTRARKRTPVQHRICPHGAAAGQVLYTLYFMSPWRSRGRSGTRGSVSVALCRAVG